MKSLLLIYKFCWFVDCDYVIVNGGGLYSKYDFCYYIF